MPVIPVLKRLRQEDHKFKTQPGLNNEFQASLGYIVRPYIKKKRKKKKKKN
jgi:hypothetical protein